MNFCCVVLCCSTSAINILFNIQTKYFIRERERERHTRQRLQASKQSNEMTTRREPTEQLELEFRTKNNNNNNIPSVDDMYRDTDSSRCISTSGRE